MLLFPPLPPHPNLDLHRAHDLSNASSRGLVPSLLVLMPELQGLIRSFRTSLSALLTCSSEEPSNREATSALMALRYASRSFSCDSNFISPATSRARPLCCCAIDNLCSPSTEQVGSALTVFMVMAPLASGSHFFLHGGAVSSSSRRGQWSQGTHSKQFSSNILMSLSTKQLAGSNSPSSCKPVSRSANFSFLSWNGEHHHPCA